MPLDADRAWSEDRVLSGTEVRAMIDRVYPLEPTVRDAHSTARTYRFADGKGEIGFVNPVTEPFCGDCNRVRLTAEGKLRTCLFSLNETDLREPLRFHRGHEHSGRWQETVAALGMEDVAVFAWDQRGHGRSPGERGSAPDLATVIRDAVWRKELKHRVSEPGFSQPPRTMSQIGG